MQHPQQAHVSWSGLISLGLFWSLGKVKLLSAGREQSNAETC